MDEAGQPLRRHPLDRGGRDLPPRNVPLKHKETVSASGRIVRGRGNMVGQLRQRVGCERVWGAFSQSSCIFCFSLFAQKTCSAFAHRRLKGKTIVSRGAAMTIMTDGDGATTMTSGAAETTTTAVATMAMRTGIGLAAMNLGATNRAVMSPVARLTRVICGTGSAAIARLPTSLDGRTTASSRTARPRQSMARRAHHAAAAVAAIVLRLRHKSAAVAAAALLQRVVAVVVAAAAAARAEARVS